MQRFLRFLLAAAVVFALAAPARAGLEEGDSSYQRGDYATALREFQPLAEQGDAVAQNNLGVMYDNGQGVAQDYVAAHMWFSLAAAGSQPGEVRDLAAGNRDNVAQNMTLAQIAKAQDLVRNFRPRPPASPD